MPVKVKVRYPRIDVKATEDRIHKAMTDFVLRQLTTWVIHTTNPVPVWSGAARASFLKLANQVRTEIQINPVAPSRIPLGIDTSIGEVLTKKGDIYGWFWESTLDHIEIVEDRVGFVEAGLRSIRRTSVELPQPVFETKEKE